MRTVKGPSVAGTFYPAEKDALREAVRNYLASAEAGAAGVRAVIAPHAGYVFSGPVAGAAYAYVGWERIRRVVLVGPSHFCMFPGLAISGAAAFATPLGEVPVDAEGRRRALSFRQVRLFDAPFEDEHALEVHLPFLQVLLEVFSLVPLLVGEASAAEVAKVIDALWDEDTLVAVSSDLSHFHPAPWARAIDGETARAIENFESERIGPRQACGHVAVRGLMEAARGRGLGCRAVELRNSADAGGPSDRVVGYGAFVFA